MAPKPGDPLGGDIFNLFTTRVLNEIAKEAKADSLIFPLPPVDISLDKHDGSVALDLFDTAFMDDCLFCVLRRCPVMMLSMLNRLASIASRIFSCHGLLLNFKSGKSEAMVAIRGHNSSLAKASLAIVGCSEVVLSE